MDGVAPAIPDNPRGQETGQGEYDFYYIDHLDTTRFRV